MKVLFDHQVFLLQKFGGISRYHYKLYEQLVSLQPESCFEIVNCGTANFYLNGHRKILNYRGRNTVWNWINKNVTLKKLRNFDVFHPTYYDTYFLSNSTLPKYVLTIHDLIPEWELQHGRSEHKKLVENKRRLIQNAAAIIAISEATKKDILYFNDINPEKISVIHHGGPDYFQGVFSKSTTKFDRPYCLYVGERGGYKNFAQAVNALSHFLKEEKVMFVVVGGKNPSSEELALIAKLDVKDYVHFVRSVNEAELLSIYQGAFCFLYPSLMEGFGIPLLEAFYASCPVICSNIEPFKEIAGNAALFFDPFSSVEMLSAVKKVYDNPSLATSLRAAGTKQLANFSWEETARRTFQVYQNV